MLDEIFELGEQPYTELDREWDQFVAQHPSGSLLQTTAWARLKGRFGWQGHRVWLKEDGRLVAGAQILFRSVLMGMVKIAYIPHGPLVDWGDEEQLAVLLNQIDFATYERRASLVKMEPLVWQHDWPAEKWAELCQKHNCLVNCDTIQPPQTVLIDLVPDLEAILGGMKQKTRYNIRLAAKKGVVVREGGKEDIAIFTRLMQTTGKRNEFGVHDIYYYQAVYELFAPEDAVLLLAEYEGQPLAGVMIFKSGETAYYLYGASNNEERNRMPTYAVQWAAIEWAKEQGCTVYDMWGVPDAPPEQLEAEFQERQDGLWGVYRFKRGFDGEIKRTVGAIDRVYNQFVYRVYQWRRGSGG